MDTIFYFILFYFTSGVIFSFGGFTIANDLKRFNNFKLFNLNRFALYILSSVTIITLITFYSQDVALLQGSDLSKVSITGQDATVTIKAPVSLFAEIGKPAVFASGLQVGNRLFKNSPIPAYSKGLISISFFFFKTQLSYLTFHTVSSLVEGKKIATVEFDNLSANKTIAESLVNKIPAPSSGSAHTLLQEIAISKKDVTSLEAKVKGKIDISQTTCATRDMDIPDITFIHSPLEPEGFIKYMNTQGID